MGQHKFDGKNLDKLDSPERVERENMEVIWPLLAADEPQVLIDLGAGSGYFSRQFASKMPEGMIYACDSSPAMVQHMQQVLSAVPGGTIRVVQVEEVRIPLDDGIADVVFMANLHHELADSSSSMREVFRLLRSGGTVCVEDWRDGVTANGPPPEVRVSEASIVANLLDAGFVGIVSHDVLPQHHLICGRKP